MASDQIDKPCVLCETRPLTLVKPGNLPEKLDPEHFAVTDYRYGVTAAIHRCAGCGLLQCADFGDPQPFYDALEDPGYEASRPTRALQLRKVLESVRSLKPAGRLMDIGAASGILVEQALALGYDAAGVEPSAAFVAAARQRQLPVHRGLFPHPDLPGPFDLVMLVDVIEHVADPVGLLRAAVAALAADGLGMVITPDVDSLAARLMGWRWWHYRIAHVLCQPPHPARRAGKAGGAQVRISRPSWYFAGDYLWDRLMSYLPPAAPARAAFRSRSPCR
jgi:SAM-dependent methyltransferase